MHLDDNVDIFKPMTHDHEAIQMDNLKIPSTGHPGRGSSYVFTPEESIKQAQANINLERLSISDTASKMMWQIASGTLTTDSAIKRITAHYKNSP